MHSFYSEHRSPETSWRAAFWTTFMKHSRTYRSATWPFINMNGFSFSKARSHLAQPCTILDSCGVQEIKLDAINFSDLSDQWNTITTNGPLFSTGRGHLAHPVTILYICLSITQRQITHGDSCTLCSLDGQSRWAYWWKSMNSHSFLWIEDKNIFL